MSKFTCMTFGISAGDNDCFVAHAGKYTAEETVRQCVEGYEYLFKGVYPYGRKQAHLRLPTIEDVQEARCAFRFGCTPEYPDGAYVIVDDDAVGSFPVFVIDFERLKQTDNGNGGET